ncbi:DUF6470 family protein [Paenibacillus sp. ACRRY]|uniref:DUF6470 family protein n=1 Tax=Paenibacillus sp. ACRRY TaxID=2918208 RepID=UPI001EF4CCAE|nr:DUF6470 family protein [Paenibacillus sp. ACRRY]MCG7384094.1 DUF6470 family protein [Paenibacillus sp. ACRRY]
MNIDTQSSSWGAYIPAEITISRRDAEMSVDWTEVFNDMDLKRPGALMKDLKQRTEIQFIQNLATKSQEGDRIANIASGEKNVFGNIAHARYMRNGQKEINVELVPKQGVHIDFRIFPPEIHIEARGVLPR